MKKYLLGVITGLLLVMSVTVIANTGIRLVINGSDITASMDVAPQIIDGRTMVPARYVAEALGASVTWHAEENAVIINSAGYSVPDATFEPVEDPPQLEAVPKPSPAHPSVKTSGMYVGSIESDKYHMPSCRWAGRILLQNEIWFDTPLEAQLKGYIGCKTCKPPIN